MIFTPIRPREGRAISEASLMAPLASAWNPRCLCVDRQYDSCRTVHALIYAYPNCTRLFCGMKSTGGECNPVRCDIRPGSIQSQNKQPIQSLPPSKQIYCYYQTFLSAPNHNAQRPLFNPGSTRRARAHPTPPDKERIFPDRGSLTQSTQPTRTIEMG